MTVWVSVASVNPVVTCNAYLNDLFTGLEPRKALILYDAESKDAAAKASKLIRELHRVWLGGDIEVELCELARDPSELLTLDLDLHGGVVVNATPGRKIQALALYRLCVSRGYELRYHLLHMEKRYGYKPFPQTPLQAITPLRLHPQVSVLKWSPPSITTSSYAEEKARLGAGVFAYLLLLLSIYEEADTITLEARKPSHTILEIELTGAKAKVKVNAENEEHEELVQAALRYTGALLPTNLTEIQDRAARATREDELLVFDTNAYMNGLPRLLPENLRRHAYPLRTVFNELWLPIDQDRTLSSPHTRLRALGLAVYQETHRDLSEVINDQRRASWRGDDAILREIREKLGPRPRAQLITCDRSLAYKAKTMLPTLLAEYTNQDTITTYLDTAAETLATAAYLLGDTTIHVGRTVIHAKPAPPRDPSKPLLQIKAPPHTTTLAAKIKETINTYHTLLTAKQN